MMKSEAFYQMKVTTIENTLPIWYLQSKSVRHGPFDILGEAWNFFPGQEFFFRQFWSKIIFFAGPSGRIIFFITKSYNIHV